MKMSNNDGKIYVSREGILSNKVKKRRGFYRYVQRNIEFYLSDANLRRDKFLRSQLSPDYGLELSIFLTFNRIREVEADVEDLKRALRVSRVLELVGETHVRRRVPPKQKTQQEVDACSLYVERLPPDTNPDTLARVFSAYGNVLMVSLPRYKLNKMVKGYGFVEFDKVSSVVAAIEKFSTYGAVLYTDDDFSSCYQCYPPVVENIPEDTEIEQPESSEKAADLVVPDPVQPEKSAPEASDENNITDDPSQPVNATVDPVSAEKQASSVVKVTEKRKKNRKKRKWQRKMNIQHMGFQIMAKVTWNRLRQRYLALQAANRRCIKAQLSKLRPAQASVTNPSARTAMKSLIPGSVITLSALKPFTEVDVDALKTRLRELEMVEYIDVEAGQQTGYLRMTSEEAAAKFLRRGPELLPAFKIEILPSSAEELYWIKIQHDRNKKFKDRQTKKKMGGGKKILLRAEKHLAVKIKLSPDRSIV